MFIVGVLILCFIANVGAVEKDETFPDINALFGETADQDYLLEGFSESNSSLRARKFNEEPVGPKVVLPPNVNVDIDKLDIKRFKEKLKSFQESLTRGVPQEGRNDSRKWSYWPPWSWWQPDPKSLNLRREVDRHAMKVRLMEMMLQLIYQAKARLQHIDSSPGFSTKDAAFRIAYLFTRMRELRRAILQIWNTMMAKQYLIAPMKPWGAVNYFIFMHFKAAQKYSDFIYLYKVAVAIHKWKDEKAGVGNTIPAAVRQYLWEVERWKRKSRKDLTRTTNTRSKTQSTKSHSGG